MIMPAIFPDWVPMWAQLALLLLGLLFAVALLLMPFAVFGLKGRLDLLEAQLDDIHADLRMLAMRLPDVEPQRSVRRSVAERDRTDTEPQAGARSARPQERPQERTQERTHPLRADNRSQPRDDREPVRDTGHERDRSEPRLRWPPAAPNRR